MSFVDQNGFMFYYNHNSFESSVWILNLIKVRYLSSSETIVIFNTWMTVTFYYILHILLHMNPFDFVRDFRNTHTDMKLGRNVVRTFLDYYKLTGGISAKPSSSVVPKPGSLRHRDRQPSERATSETSVRQFDNFPGQRYGTP